MWECPWLGTCLSPISGTARSPCQHFHDGLLSMLSLQEQDHSHQNRITSFNVHALGQLSFSSIFWTPSSGQSSNFLGNINSTAYLLGLGKMSTTSMQSPSEFKSVVMVPTIYIQSSSTAPILILLGLLQVWLLTLEWKAITWSVAQAWRGRAQSVWTLSETIA